MPSGEPISCEPERSASADDADSRALIQSLDPPDGSDGIFDRILSGMAARGHVLEAISQYLRLSRTELVAHIERLGLPMPSGLPMRKPGGRNPWPLVAIRCVIKRWPENLHVDCIAAEIGRSPGAVRSKAWRMGLYRRNRRDLIKRPTGLAVQAAIEESDACTVGPTLQPDVEETVAPLGLADEPPGPLSILMPDAEEETLATTNEVVEAAKEQCDQAEKAGRPVRRPRTVWIDDLDMNLARRWFAWQCRHGIGKDLGLTEATVRSRANLLGLPPRRDRKKIVPDYVPGRPYDRSLEAGLVRRRCGQGHMFFWGTPNGPRTCPKVRKSKRYRELRSGLAEACLHL